MNLYPASTVIPIYAVFCSIGILLTCLRFWVRISYTKQKVGPDDYFILLGVIVAIACTSIQFYNALRGTGGDVVSAQEQHARAILAHKVDFSMLVIEKLAFGAVKISLLLFYRRIFGVWPGFTLINNLLLAFVAVWTVSFAMADLLLCGRRIELQWALDQSIAYRACGDKGAALVLFAATSILTDALVLGLPLLYIGKLKMNSSKRVAASIVFFLGTISTLAGILRLVFLSIAYPMGRLDFTNSRPKTTPLILQIFNPTFWAMVEMLLGVWAANLPPLSPLLKAPNHFNIRRTWRKLSGSGSRSGSGKSSEKEDVSV